MIRLFLLTIMGGLVGCSSAPEACYPVSGRVELDGEPWRNGGTVLFERVAPGNSKKSYTARGVLDGTGHFQLSTFGQNDGAVVGRHRASVLAAGRFVAGADGEGVPVEHPVPEHYAALEDSGLEFEVLPTRNEFVLSLTSTPTALK